MTKLNHKCLECEPTKCTLKVFGNIDSFGKKQSCGALATWSSNLGNFCERCHKWVMEDKLGKEMSDDLQVLINKGKKND